MARPPKEEVTRLKEIVYEVAVSLMETKDGLIDYVELKEQIYKTYLSKCSVRFIQQEMFWLLKHEYVIPRTLRAFGFQSVSKGKWQKYKMGCLGR